MLRLYRRRCDCTAGSRAYLIDPMLLTVFWACVATPQTRQLRSLFYTEGVLEPEPRPL